MFLYQFYILIYMNTKIILINRINRKDLLRKNNIYFFNINCLLKLPIFFAQCKIQDFIYLNHIEPNRISSAEY